MNTAFVLGLFDTGIFTMQLLESAGIKTVGFESEPSLIKKARSSGVDFRVVEGGLWVEAILAEVGKSLGKPPVVIPTSDALVLLLHENRARLEPHVLLAISGSEALKKLESKSAQAEFAERIGLRTPATTR